MKYTIKILLLTLLVWGCAGKQETKQLPDLIRPIKYGEVIRSGGKNVHTFSGVAQSGQESKLSFRVAGTIRNLNVKLGDRVRRGQVIASIDPTDYNVSAEQAVASKKGSDANLKSAETQLINARINYNRIEKLYESNSVPLSDFDQAKSNYETAQASYEAAKTQVTSTEKQVEAANNQISYTRLTAPFNGVITGVFVEENELVGSGSPVAALSSEAEPEVNVGIPETLISKVKRNMPVAIQFSAFEGQNFQGKVEEVSFAAGNSPTYPAIISIKKPGEGIRPGMAADVTFNFSADTSQSYLVSPVQSIGEDADGNFVFLLEPVETEKYLVKKQAIKVGELLPDGFEIRSGLQEGDLVAVAGMSILLDSMKVRLVEN
ncbi:MAG: efflux RND transporter periplasmic adaptor subunit [Bacteroidota bacterium]